MKQHFINKSSRPPSPKAAVDVKNGNMEKASSSDAAANEVSLKLFPILFKLRENMMRRNRGCRSLKMKTAIHMVIDC